MIKLMKKQQQLHKVTTGIFSKILEEQKWMEGAPMGTIVKAKVVGINTTAKKVIVETGCKSNSVISFLEFKLNGEENIPEINSHIMVMIKNIDNYSGLVVASYREVKIKERTEELTNLFQQKKNIEVYILYKLKFSSFYNKNNHNQSSYVVDLGYGLSGVCQIDYNVQPGDKILAQITNIVQKRLGISLIALPDENHNSTEQIQENDETIVEGEKFDIRITEIKDFGIIGEKVNKENKSYNKNYNPNSIFVHVKELFWNKRNRNMNEISLFYKINQIITVISINSKDKEVSSRNKIIYSVRETFKDLCTQFQQYIKNNNIISIVGKVTEKRNDHLLVSLPFPYGEDQKINEYLEGKLYMKDLSWNDKEIVNIQRELDVSSTITCKIMNFTSFLTQIVDGYGFIPLSVKHLTPDPFQETQDLIKIGQVYPCQFLEYNDNYRGFLVGLMINNQLTTSNDVMVLIKSKDLGSCIGAKIGTQSECKIIKIEFQDRLFIASIKAAEIDNKDTLLKEYDSKNKHEASTLGHIIDNMKK